MPRITAKRGVASQLLQAVLDEAKQNGNESVEAYPKKRLNDSDAFEGPLAIYETFGFDVISAYKDFLVVRKRLRVSS
jgi:GNAT superfamily N-acetyltransferase